MKIETEIIPVADKSPKFVQGKIEEVNDVFSLSRKEGKTHTECSKDTWRYVGIFSTLRGAIERSSKDDFFNTTYDKANKIWPQFK